ncbi:hypothetical protein GGF31_001720 [Allomyces arbusculus]|nr:hypothetical protein GGF31_001720 [Allomyces arbusculus]
MKAYWPRLLAGVRVPPVAADPAADPLTAAEDAAARTAIEDANQTNRPPPRQRHNPVNVVLPWCEYTPTHAMAAIVNNTQKMITNGETGEEEQRAVAARPTATSVQLLDSIDRVFATRLGQWVGAWMPATWTSSSTATPVSWTKRYGVPSSLDRVAVLGIHGWFPIRTVQRIVGEPTGTSRKFCEQMHLALQKWVQHHYPGAELPASKVTLVPLEWEGKVEDRVDHLFEQVIDLAHSHPGEKAKESWPSHKSYWQHQIESATTVFVATHSQGTPTSIMLVERLIETGIIDPKRQRVVILAQAGISHGPFPWNGSSMYVKYLEADAARELFEFNKHDSPVAKRYYKAVERLLEHDIRLVLVSSWLDQVVPLYSSAFHALSHPNVYRAVFIEAEQFFPNDFLPHLVVFALKLRNAGISDQDLLVYLSDVVAGSLYFGTGHSTLYEDVRVYELAINFLFADRPRPAAQGSGFWSSLFGAAPSKACEIVPFDAPHRLNSYHLPWILNSIFSNKEIQAHPTLAQDMRQLLQLFKDWDVSGSKARRDLKFKLDPLHRAKL